FHSSPLLVGSLRNATSPVCPPARTTGYDDRSFATYSQQKLKKSTRVTVLLSKLKDHWDRVSLWTREPRPAGRSGGQFEVDNPGQVKNNSVSIDQPTRAV